MRHSVLIFLLVSVIYGATASASDWDIQIIPHKVTTNSKVITNNFRDPFFYVILTNKTKAPLKIWKEWCSWGFFSISFSVTPKVGQPFTLRRTGGGWTWNFADATLVDPGKSYVFRASIVGDGRGSRPYAGFPEQYKEGEVTIQAIFSIEETAETKKQGVWTGTNSSVPETVTLQNGEHF
jgi:hypothetical protein